MQYGMVRGTVVSTQKVKELQGHILKVLIPCDKDGTPTGEPLIAVDPIKTRPGDHVLWVGKREASLAIPNAPLSNLYPIDAAITGIIDDIG